jgi:hypothetical protein
MSMKLKFFSASKLFLIFSASLLLVNCVEDSTLLDATTSIASTSVATSATSGAEDCTLCTYVVPANAYVVDGALLNLQPGSIIGLSSTANYKNLVFRNINGTAENPIIIRNCGGGAILNSTGLSFGIKTENSKYFKITGGSTPKVYGITITGPHIGMTMEKLSTNFEIDHVEISNTGFAGIMAKTDPTCDDATIRGNFIMKNVTIRDNFVHDTGGEGFYLGSSFYEGGYSTTCGTRYPHEIWYIKVYGNIIKNSGWDGLQLGCATKGAKVYGNTIENYGTKNAHNQNSGIQIGEGTGGLCYGNLVNGGTGSGMSVLGLADNVVYNNVINNAGAFGIFCDDRVTLGPGFKFINNTIVNPKLDGLRLYADKVEMNLIINNIIVNPGSYTTYVYPRTSADAFVYKLSKYVNVDMSNNLFSTSADSPQFINVLSDNYRIASTSPAVDAGRDISPYGILTDYYKKARLRGVTYDIGAAEYGN